MDHAADNPNIVVHMIDALGWNLVSAQQASMGTHSGAFLTPHLEKCGRTVGLASVKLVRDALADARY